jgi:hypothetical protein
VTELLESCHDSSRNTNKDGTLTGGTIDDSRLKFLERIPHTSQNIHYLLESPPSLKPKKRKRDYSCNNRSTSSTSTPTPDNQTPPEFSQKLLWQSDSHRARKAAKRFQTHASRLHRKLSAIAREQHEGRVVMFVGLSAAAEREGSRSGRKIARKIRGDMYQLRRQR